MQRSGVLSTMWSYLATAVLLVIHVPILLVTLLLTVRVAGLSRRSGWTVSLLLLATFGLILGVLTHITNFVPVGGSGEFGDSFGALAGIFSALAFAVASIALWYQSRELGLSRREMEQARKVQERLEELHRRQTKINERSFFQKQTVFLNQQIAAVRDAVEAISTDLWPSIQAIRLSRTANDRHDFGDQEFLFRNDQESLVSEVAPSELRDLDPNLLSRIHSAVTSAGEIDSLRLKWNRVLGHLPLFLWLPLERAMRGAMRSSRTMHLLVDLSTPFGDRDIAWISEALTGSVNVGITIVSMFDEMNEYLHRFGEDQAEYWKTISWGWDPAVADEARQQTAVSDLE